MWHPERMKAPPPPSEQARYFMDERLPGLELFEASFVKHSFAPHTHDCYAIGVIEQGALRFDYMGREHLATSGCVNLVVPGEAHNGDAGSGPGWSYRMLYIAPDLVRQAAQQAGYRGGLPAFSSGVLRDDALARQVRRLHRTLERGDAPGLALDHGLLQVLALWVRRHAELPSSPGRAGREPAAVRRALEYLHARFDQDVRLEELSGQAHLSPFHLARVFGRSVGVPPGRYLVQLRVSKARELLKGALPLCEIAAACGFSDQSHMTRQFKRILGVPPGSYRKMIQDR